MSASSIYWAEIALKNAEMARLARLGLRLHLTAMQHRGFLPKVIPIGFDYAEQEYQAALKDLEAKREAENTSPAPIIPRRLEIN
ncbi:hypothetical protein [Methylomagnum sp.]